MKQWKKELPLILLILVLAGVKYLFQVIYLNPFEIDQEFLALEAWNFLKEGKATLIGAHTSVGGMYIGPFYTYFITLMMALTHLNPFTINALSTLWSIATAVALYLIGRKLYSREVGLIAGLLAAISINYLAISDVPPLVIPLGLVSLLTFYCLSQLEQNKLWFFAAVFLAGIGIHLHFTGLYLSAFIIFWLLINRPKNINKFDLAKAAGMIFLFLTPLIAFDLRHQFLNSRNFITFLLTTNGLKVLIASIFRSFRLALGNLGALFNNFQVHNLLVSSIVWIIFILYFIFKTNRTKYDKLLIVWLIFPIVVNGLYTGDLLPYYYIFHQAQIFLVIGLLLAKITRTQIGCTILVTLALMYSFLNLRWHLSHGNAFRLQNKVAAFELITKLAGTTNINLSFTVEHSRRGGMDFLRRYYGFDTGLLPDRPTYTILVPHHWHRLNADYSFGEIDVILPETKK